jgi:uncharacterized protein
MPPLTLDDNKASYQIRAYKPGFIKINDITYTQSLIVSPTELITDWKPQTVSELNPADLQKIISMKPALLLIGTGEKIFFPPVEIYGELINQGIGVEIMDTSAACRTYNALTSENRNVIAALIIK